jgi:phosphoenolpyruvate carboxykinase (diphosphate)
MANVDNSERYVGLRADGGQPKVDGAALHRSIIVKLAAQGFAVPGANEEASILELAGDLFQRYAEQSRLLSDHLAPPDQRIQAFLDDILSRVGESVTLPRQTLIVDRYG